MEPYIRLLKDEYFVNRIGINMLELQIKVVVIGYIVRHEFSVGYFLSFQYQVVNFFYTRKLYTTINLETE